MAPQGLALQHEVADLLTDWEKFGCPTQTGRDWSLAEIQAAIDRGPHKSAIEPDAIANVVENEVDNKVVKGQVRAVLWDDIKDNHPGQLTGVSSVQQSNTNLGPTGQSCTCHSYYGSKMGRHKIGQRHHEKMGPEGGNQSTWALPKMHRSRVRRGRRRCGNPHGKMGHPRWFSGSSTAAKETSGILLCMATGTNGTMPAGGTKLATNGMGGLCTIFLRCIRHGKRHCSQR